MHPLSRQWSTGEMVEWSITVVLKTTVPRGTGGSNPSLSAESSMSNIVELFFLRSDQSIFFNGLDCKWNRNRLIFSSYVHKQPFVRWRQSPVVFAKVCNRQNIQTLHQRLLPVSKIKLLPSFFNVIY